MEKILKTGKYGTLAKEPSNGVDGLLHEIIEGRMRGKPTRGRRRITIL